MALSRRIERGISDQLQLMEFAPDFTEVLRDVLIIDDKSCPHNLISLGKLGREHRVATVLGAGTDPSFLQFSDGTRALG